MVILAGDVGGTKVHLALFKEGKHWLTDEKFRSREYASLSIIIKEFLERHRVKVAAACFGIAGPVQDGKCRTTNLPWVVDSAELEKELNIPHVWLINDLQANAHGIFCLKKEELLTINAGKKLPGNQALIAAGTGLGEAGLYWDGKEHHAFGCEGGHCSFAPESELEIELWRYLKKKFPRISFERILSGAGLVELYRFVVESGVEAPASSLNEGNEAKQISERALSKTCPACIRALEMFIAIYGSESGNLALKMLSIGGFFIGGGIAPKIAKAFEGDLFFQRFTSKGRFRDVLLQMPVYLIMNENTALLGAARYARDHS